MYVCMCMCVCARVCVCVCVCRERDLISLKEIKNYNDVVILGFFIIKYIQ